MRTTRATRQVLAVMVVATALCADRVTSAAPVALRPQAVRTDGAQVPQVVQLAGRLVNSLSQRFRRVVPAALLQDWRSADETALPAPIAPVDQLLSVARQPVSPFQFRLPPPVV